MKKSKSVKGFTLIEMLIVLAILSILYSIAALNVTGMQTEAKIAKAHGDLKTLKLAIGLYIMNNNVCPDKEDYQRVLAQKAGNLLSGNLIDPFGVTMNTLYSYEISDNKQNYVVYSVGTERNGIAAIGNYGRVSAEGSAIFETNGYD